MCDGVRTKDIILSCLPEPFEDESDEWDVFDVDDDTSSDLEDTEPVECVRDKVRQRYGLWACWKCAMTTITSSPQARAVDIMSTPALDENDDPVVPPPPPPEPIVSVRERVQERYGRKVL